MADNIITVKVEGVEKLATALDRFPQQIGQYMASAGDEAGHEIIQTEGLQKYPAETAANRPPTPYYIRGRGTQRKRGNDGRSERYGSQFYVTSETFTTTIGNRASYARYLAGEEQARAMERIGWRRLIDVAREKIEGITKIYNAWVEKAIHDLGL